MAKYGFLATIGADTSGLTVALKQIDNESKNVNSNLRAIKEGLKFQPKSLELLESQASALSDQIDITSKKLEALKSVEDDVNAARESGNMSKSGYDSFLKQISDTEAKLKTLNIELTSTKGRIEDIQNSAPKVTALSELDKQLSEIQKSLQLNPGNLELVTQKYFNLGKQITETRNKLEELKRQQNEMTESSDYVSSDEYEAMRRKILDTEAELRRLISAQNDMVDDKGKLKDIASGYEEIEDNAKKARKSVITLGDLIKSNLIADFLGDALRQVSGYVKDFIGQGIELASDLTEVQNVVDTTFGDGAGKIYDWADAAATSFGMSSLQAQKYNGTMGAMLKSMGLTDDAVLKMSTDMVGLAGDMASFYNLDVEDAFYKIRAGISGETEPLKALGINMSVANLEAFALSQGIEKTWEQMDQAEQAALRYNYLMSQTADAQGDFSKTSDSYANQQRILKLQIDNLSASLGEQLLPHLNDIIITVNDKLPEISEKADEIFSKIGDGIGWIMDNGDLVIGIVEGLAVSFGVLTVAAKFDKITSGLSNIKKGVEAAGAAMAAHPLITALTLITAAALAAKGALNNYTESMDVSHIDDHTRAIMDETDAIKAQKREYDDLIEKKNENIESDLAEADNVKRLWTELQRYTNESGKVYKERERADEIISLLNENYGLNIGYIDGQIQGYQELASAMDDYIEKLRIESRIRNGQEAYDAAVKNYDELIKKRDELVEQQNVYWETDKKLLSQGLDIQWGSQRGALDEEIASINELIKAEEKEMEEYESLFEEKNKLGDTSSIGAGNGGSESSDDDEKTDIEKYEEKLQEKNDEIEHLFNTRQINAEERDKMLVEALNDDFDLANAETLKKDSELYYKLLGQHEDYIEDKKKADEKAAEDERKAAEKAAEDAKKAADEQTKAELDEIKERHEAKGDEIDYTAAAAELESELISKGCDKNAETWKSYYKTVEDYRKKADKQASEERKKANEKALDDLKDTLKESGNAIEDSYKEIAKDRENAIKEFSDISLSETIKDKNGNETEVLTDLDAESKRLDKYMSSLEKLKQTGISDSLLEQVYAKSYDDGSRQKFIDTILGLSENNRKLYYEDWEKLQGKQQEAADMSISDKLKDVNMETTNSVEDVFGSMSALAYEDGEETARSYLQGIIDGMGGLNDINTISSIFNTALFPDTAATNRNNSTSDNSKMLSAFSGIKLTINVNEKETVTKTIGELIGMGAVSGGAVFNI